MDDIKQAISDFDDKVSSIMSKQCEMACKNFATSYWDTFATIWNKANNVSMKTVIPPYIATTIQPQLYPTPSLSTAHAH